MQVLKQQQRLLAAIAKAHATHRAVRRTHERRLVVRAAIVVAGQSERDRERGGKERRRLRKERRPPRGKRAEPGVIERHRSWIARRWREERRRNRGTDVRVEPDVRGVEGPERQIAKEGDEANRGGRGCEPPPVRARRLRKAAARTRDLNGLHGSILLVDLWRFGIQVASSAECR